MVDYLFWENVFNLLDAQDVLNERPTNVVINGTPQKANITLNAIISKLQSQGYSDLYPEVSFGNYSNNWSKVLDWIEYSEYVSKNKNKGFSLNLVKTSPGKITYDSVSFT